MAVAPDGRIFVTQQTGALRVIRDGVLLSQPFVTLSTNTLGERGLLGVALDPNFATTPYVYLYYTSPTAPPRVNRVVRFTASASNPDVADAGSALQLIELSALSTAYIHNGGALAFGTDGKLYIATGDNSDSANAQSLETTHGKLLRINPDGSIPEDNPFLGQTTGVNQAIWARGLRNPYTFAVDPSNGRIHINDVGQDAWEEVNHAIAGANFGWPQTEGFTPGGVAGVRYPAYVYANAGSNCAIVGAAFYRPSAANFPAAYAGRYFFGDYCSGFIRTLAPPAYSTATAFATGIAALVDIEAGPDGSLYYLASRQRRRAVSSAVHRELGTVDLRTTGECVGVCWSARDVYGLRFRVRSHCRYQWLRNGASISRCDSVLVHDSIDDRRGQRRADLCNRDQSLRLGNQHGCHAYRVVEWRTERDDLLARAGHAVSWRSDIHVLWLSDRSGRRRPARLCIHLARGLPSR